MSRTIQQYQASPKAQAAGAWWKQAAIDAVKPKPPRSKSRVVRILRRLRALIDGPLTPAQLDTFELQVARQIDLHRGSYMDIDCSSGTDRILALALNASNIRVGKIHFRPDQVMRVRPSGIKIHNEVTGQTIKIYSR